MKGSVLVRLVAVCVALNLGGGACMGGCCESAEVSQYEGTQRKARQHEIETFEYRRPLAELWPELVGILREHGYELSEKSPVEGKTLETTFKPASLGEYRFLVRVIPIEGARYRVTFDKQFRHTDADGGTTVEIEDKNAGEAEATQIAWTLAQRVEPARMLDAEKSVKGKAERAGAVGRGCDRGCATCGALVTPRAESR